MSGGRDEPEEREEEVKLKGEGRGRGENEGTHLLGGYGVLNIIFQLFSYNPSTKY